MDAQEVRIDGLGGDEVLDDVRGTVGQHGAYGHYIGLLEKRWNYGGTELMANLMSPQDAYGQRNRGKRRRVVDNLLVACGRSLDVHGHVVEQSVIQQPGQHVGVGPVCVELDLVAEFMDLAEEGREVLLKGWLSSGDTDAVQLSRAVEKEVEEHGTLESWGVIT